MTEAELITQISNTIGKRKVLELSRILKEQRFTMVHLINITFHPDKAVAFRAAWLLENVLLANPDFYVNDLAYLVSRIRQVNNPSCMRHYAKIIMHITDAKAPPIIQQKLKGIDLAPVVEQLFDWTINPKIKVAVKVFACRALFNMKHTFPWIAEELAGQLQYLMRDGSAGVQSRGKNILREL